MKRFSFVVLPLTLVALVAAGCATTSPTAYPSAAPQVFVGPDTDAPRIEHSDAAGVLSAPGFHSATPEVVVTPSAPVPAPAPGVVTPAPPAPAPVIIVPKR